MGTISKEELEKILEKHRYWYKHWIEGETGMFDGMRANLRGVDLSGMDLSGADLREACLDETDLNEANLRNADLNNARLRRANLYGADLSGSNLKDAYLTVADLGKANLIEARLIGACLIDADLSGANLSEANLRRASLSSAYLSGASLIRANLCNAKLWGANLIMADLRGAELRGAELCCADLSDVDLRGANLSDANLRNAILPEPEIMNTICPLNCPETGAFIGWKKADVMMPDEVGIPRAIPVIIKLQIPARAIRSSATSRKCRCNKALVLDIQTLDGESLPKWTVANSKFYPTFKYKVGQNLWVKDFDDNRWNECSTGIHFFITRQEAVDYVV